MTLRAEWNRKMERAEERCRHVAESERVMGYQDNALLYREMADEMNIVKWWMLGLRDASDAMATETAA